MVLGKLMGGGSKKKQSPKSCPAAKSDLATPSEPKLQPEVENIKTKEEEAAEAIYETYGDEADEAKPPSYFEASAPSSTNNRRSSTTRSEDEAITAIEDSVNVAGFKRNNLSTQL